MVQVAIVEIGPVAEHRDPQPREIGEALRDLIGVQVRTTIVTGGKLFQPPT